MKKKEYINQKGDEIRLSFKNLAKKKIIKSNN